MKKKLPPILLINLFLFLFIIGCRQKTSLLNTGCQKGKNDAKNNFEKGNLKIIDYGMLVIDDPKFEQFYNNQMKQQFNITFDNVGCVVSQEVICYTEMMEQLIIDKYGDGFFENSRKKAKANFKPEIISQIEKGKVFYQIDTMPKYINNLSLTDYLINRLDNPKKLNGKSLITFIIEKNGDISNVRIRKSIDSTYDKKLIKVISEMPKWSPGIYYNKKVRVETAIPITYKN